MIILLRLVDQASEGGKQSASGATLLFNRCYRDVCTEAGETAITLLQVVQLIINMHQAVTGVSVGGIGDNLKAISDERTTFFDGGGDVGSKFEIADHQIR